MAFGCFAKQPIHSLGCLCFTFLPEAEQSILARSAREHIVWCRSPVSPPKVGCRSQSAFEYLILMGCPKSNLLKLHEQRDRPSSIRKPSFEHQTPVQPEMCLGGGGGLRPAIKFHRTVGRCPRLFLFSAPLSQTGNSRATGQAEKAGSKLRYLGASKKHTAKATKFTRAKVLGKTYSLNRAALCKVLIR